MSVEYSHDQFGTLVVAMCGIFGLATFIILMSAGISIPAVSVALVSVLLIALFFRLRVEVSRSHLSFRFGVGLIGRRFAMDEVAAAHPVRNKWYYGWGIRLTPHGWLYNVSGFDAVEVHMRSGKKCRIGTDEPQTLADAVNRAIQS